MEKERTLMMHKILFVDDDELILRGLKRSLEEYSTFWEYDFALSGIDALQKLKTKSYDAIISDLLMPVMDGLKLLEIVNEEYPEVMRFVLSGNTNDAQALKSVSLVHQMFPKPCGMNQIFKSVEQACRLRDALADPKLIRVVTKIKTLPSPPAHYHKLVNELSEKEPNMKKVAEIVSKDSAMTAKILQLVNSAFFGLADEISSPQRAVALLGLNTTKALVLSAQIFSEYEKKKNVPLTIKNLWNHSMMVSNISRKIAIELGFTPAEQENAQVAGILHDIGKLLQLKVPEFANLLNFYSKRLPVETEYEHLSTSHAEMGAYLLGVWGLPNTIVEAVMYHHIPSKQLSTAQNALTAVHIANGLLQMCTYEDCKNLEDNLDLLYVEQVVDSMMLQGWIQYIADMLNK
jgi:putative nucleotidyltransferase with HDIG domain